MSGACRAMLSLCADEGLGVSGLAADDLTDNLRVVQWLDRGEVQCR